MVLVAAVTAAAMIGWVVYDLTGSVVIDIADVYTSALRSPVSLVFPIIYLLPAFDAIARPVSHRFASQLWNRMPMSKVLAGWAARVAGIVGLTVVLSLAAVIAFVFLCVPVMFPNVFDPVGYGLTPETAAQELLTRFNFGILGAAGYLGFAILFALLWALQAVIYALLALGIALVSGRVTLALFAPFATFLLGTVLLSVVNLPSFSPLFVLVPFGRLHTGDWQPILTLFVLAATASAFWIWTVRDPRRSPALA